MFELNIDSYNLVTFTLDKIRDSIHSSLEKQDELFESSNMFTKEYIDR